MLARTLFVVMWTSYPLDGKTELSPELFSSHQHSGRTWDSGIWLAVWSAHSVVSGMARVCENREVCSSHGSEYNSLIVRCATCSHRVADNPPNQPARASKVSKLLLTVGRTASVGRDRQPVVLHIYMRLRGEIQLVLHHGRVPALFRQTLCTYCAPIMPAAF